ncbi:TPA: hypothetical protein SMF67_000811 [Serratia marcescens]|uniref:hypothetical protein n=1 Tax=Serratia marcescens TaxID=615 RepID=UPI0013D953D9|nr:hypothetical protein [Serratia marcescens]MDU7468619.1 hypothetical protein [Serratia marcescens]WAZ00958.1 hypothetical protein O3T14_18715 [Serratia marcescens]HAT3796590.1 hypothetical protein [Serratia marcescens]HEJ7090186.1 hypothetical protein [Serratia marcescens]
MRVDYVLIGNEMTGQVHRDAYPLSNITTGGSRSTIIASSANGQQTAAKPAEKHFTVMRPDYVTPDGKTYAIAVGNDMANSMTDRIIQDAILVSGAEPI